MMLVVINVLLGSCFISLLVIPVLMSRVLSVSNCMLLVSHIVRLIVVLCAILKSTPGCGFPCRSSDSLTMTSFSDVGWASSQTDRRSTSGYCMFVGSKLVTWCTKKQNAHAHFSAEAEYHTMAHTASEMLWVCSLLWVFDIVFPAPVPMFCDNQVVIFTANNLVS